MFKDSKEEKVPDNICKTYYQITNLRQIYIIAT